MCIIESRLRRINNNFAISRSPIGRELAKKKLNLHHATKTGHQICTSVWKWKQIHLYFIYYKFALWIFLCVVLDCSWSLLSFEAYKVALCSKIAFITIFSSKSTHQAMTFPFILIPTKSDFFNSSKFAAILFHHLH